MSVSVSRLNMKIALCEAQNWRCCYCGIRVDIAAPKRRYRATFEHVIPKAHGGKNDRDNLVIACDPCNRHRGNMPLTAVLRRKNRRLLRAARIKI